METVISILTHNRVDITKRCLNSIMNTLGSFKIVVTDNVSTDDTVKYLQGLNDITLIENKENVCFSKAHNNVIQKFPDSDIVLMNNDIEVLKKSWLTTLQEYIVKFNLGAASPAIKQYGGLNAGAVLDEHARGRSLVNDFDTTPDWITGSCFYITRDTITRIGLLDEVFNFYYEDVDYCLRMKKNSIKFKTIRDVQIIHHDSASSNPTLKKQMLEESRKYFCKKWGYRE